MKTQKNTKMKKIISAVLCVVLIAAVALLMTACSTDKPSDVTNGNVTPGYAEVMVADIGKGETAFTFTVSHSDGSQAAFIVHTDKKTVGEALTENALLSGEDGPYGLYVKTVDGETLDYETHGLYWAFYQGNEMSPVGVDMTDIVPDGIYSFKAEK